MSDMVERVARAIDGADVGYSISLTRLVDGVSTYTAICNGETREFEEHYEASEWVSQFKLEAKARAAIAAMQADAAPVADSEDWRKAWRSVALLSSEHEDVRLNEAVAELHSVFEAYAHPPVADRVSTSSPVDDRETGNTSDKDLIERVALNLRLAGMCHTHTHSVQTAQAAIAAIQANADLDRIKRERDQAVEALREIDALDGEINPSNYDHEDACYLNRQFCYAGTIASTTLASIEGAGHE